MNILKRVALLCLVAAAGASQAAAAAQSATPASTRQLAKAASPTPVPHAGRRARQG